MLPKTERLRRSSVFQRAYSGRKSVVSNLFTLYVLPRTPGKRNTPLLPQGKESILAAKPLPEQALAAGKSKRSPLVGFVSSKKVCKNACDRNLVKRRAREAYRLIRTNLNEIGEDAKGSMYDVSLSLPGWYALVWVLNENALNASWQEIYKRMEECLVEAARKFGKRGRTAESADPGR